MLIKIHGFAVLVAAAALAGLASPQSWPPRVQEVPAESPPLSPTAAVKTFYMPPGYSVELVASEPLVQDPVAIDWDPAGRLWVVEMAGYMRNISGANARDAVGRVVVLQDENGDGRMDTRTVFADGLVLARAVKVLDRGVLVGEPPNAWLMRDTNGDLRMDTKELVTNQYGRLETDPQNNANGFYWALDNWIHVAAHEITLRLKNGSFEVRPTLRRGQWGVTQDDAGRVYRNTNESALHVDLVPTAAYARNPNLLRTRGSYERLADDNPELNVTWPARPTPATNRAYQSGILRADGSLARFTAVCAPLVYRGDRLPADLYGNVFVAEPAANLVSRIVLDEDSTTLRARKAYERGEFLASTDERFRPVYLSNAPDGTLYVVDMYRGILEDRLSMTEYLRDQILARKLEQPIGLGRIYRVVHATTRRETSNRPAPLSTASPAQLVAALAHPNGWWRDTAQRLIVERRPLSAVPALTRLADSAPNWRVRLHALWTLDGIDAIEPATVARALEHPSSYVRAAAIRLAERWLGERDHRLQSAVLKRLRDADAGVRRQLAASLGALPSGAREPAVAALLDAHGDDPVTLDAALSGLRGVEAAVLERILRIGARESAQREASVAMLSATIVRSAQEDAIQDLIARIAGRGTDSSRRSGGAAAAEWQRSALLRGMEIALLGTAMPGTAAPRSPVRETAAAVPCPTCPGGRAGPGGAYAYPRPPADGGASGRGGARLRLNREPVALSALPAADRLTERVRAVLARVSWPGKAGDTAVLPLTADDQRRFDAGREIYKTVCQACHQPDGRGQDKLAPTLIGASFTLGPPGIPVRILLNGKEGTFGLMPAIGATLTDEQIASVLTYVRREWGQGATPVDAATVKAVRALSLDRTRPWTDGELRKLAGKE
jgi:mono/diheme cytochrome c family protein/glucose/arabinose dehydrogenase